MSQKKYFFAADLGATSGRTILGTVSDGRMETEELTRFPNKLITIGHHVYWDLYALYNEIVGGLSAAADRGVELSGIGIDTWGCDFAFFGADGTMLANPVAYRDPHTDGIMPRYFEHALSQDEVYERTGIQFMNFNSLFQLYALKESAFSPMRSASKVLFIPDALMYMLTGEAVCEYTVASTSQMLNPNTRELDNDLIESVGLTRGHFGRMVQPAEVVGTLAPEVQRLTGLGAVPVIAVAGHDTASAVAAVPAADENFAYLSSGTWSLMGLETKHPIINDESQSLNFTNEGGIEGTTRFLKNICGLWLYERSRALYPEAQGKSHHELQVEAGKQEAFRSLINPDDPMFANPDNMVEAIRAYCRDHGEPEPRNYAETIRCIFDSLALRYRQVFGYLRQFAESPLKVLHVIGGGSVNAVLDQYTANALQVSVLAGPQEGTAMGNIMLQAKAAGVVKDVWEMRRTIANSIKVTRYEPQDADEWQQAYDKYLQVTRR